MEPSSQSDALRLGAIQTLEGQLRESFGRVVYTHKTQEKQADILFRRSGWIRFAQLVLSALTTAGFVFLVVDTLKEAAIVGGVVSALLLVLTFYIKDADIGTAAQRHRQAASELWLVREKYESLIADLKMGRKSLEEGCEARDNLTTMLHSLYAGAPSTGAKAYKQAQKSLRVSGDMTFSEAEIDKFLPKELHTNFKS